MGITTVNTTEVDNILEPPTKQKRLTFIRYLLDILTASPFSKFYECEIKRHQFLAVDLLEGGGDFFKVGVQIPLELC